jgi:hypothetical protein
MHINKPTDHQESLIIKKSEWNTPNIRIAEILSKKLPLNELLIRYEKLIQIKIHNNLIDKNYFKAMIKDKDWIILWGEFKITNWNRVKFIVLDDEHNCHIIPPKNKTWL